MEVATEEAALAAAGQLGWPVVLKPADQDGGKGACPSINSAERLSAEYKRLSAEFRRLLVEKFIEGTEYRLIVLNGRFFWGIERVPAAVRGDGVTTLHALVDAENARRRTVRLTDTSGWEPIEIDEDAIAYLRDCGWTMEDTPPAGQVVQVRRVPNGHGSGSLACFDDVHPDNRVLVERAAQVLRLDVTGVDLIIPDISRSWRDVGGAITEVNAMPQIGNMSDRNLVVRVLQQLVPGQGRVPLAFVLAAGDAPAWVEAIHARLHEAGLRTGLSTEAGLRIGADWIRQGRTSMWDDVQAMQMDPTLGAMLVVGDGSGFLQTGLPFDAVDALVVAAHAPQVLQLVLPYCGAFRAVLGGETASAYGDAVRAQAGKWLILPDDREGESRVVDGAVAALLSAEAAYARAEPVAPEIVRHLRP